MRLYLILALCLGFCAPVYAQLSSNEQLNLVEDIAKNDRREMWRGGFEEVSSQVERPTKNEIDEAIKLSPMDAEPLATDEIAAIYSCYNAPARCVVYTIYLYSEMYGGSGTSRRWVFLDPATGAYESILQSVYEE